MSAGTGSKQAVMSKKKSVFIAVLLFAVALLPRLICLMQLNKSAISDMLVLDSADYDQWAWEIARGNWVGTRVFYGMPFYSYFLGVLYYLFGHFLSVVRFVQIAIGAVNCLLAFSLAKRMFGTAVAIISFLLCAFFGQLILYDMMIVSTSLITFFYLMLCLALFSFTQQPTARRIFLLGIILGISCLVAANGLMFIPVVILWLFFWFCKGNAKGALRYSAVFLVAVTLAIFPVTLRNYLIAKDFVLITAHGGLNFYLGNNPRADGTNVDLPFLSSGSSDMISDSIAVAERERGTRLKPSEVSGFWFQKGRAFVRAHPARFFGLLMTKVRLFLLGYELPDIFHYNFYADHVSLLKGIGALPMRTYLVFPLGLLGLITALYATELRKRRFLIVCSLFLLSYTFSVILFLVNTRYKIPILPLMLLFSAYCIMYLYNLMKQKRWGMIGIGLAVFLVFYMILNSKTLYKEYLPNQSATHVFFGGYLLDKGKIEAAIDEFKKAATLSPRKGEVYNMLGLAYLEHGDLTNAEAALKKSIQLKPALIAAHNNLGKVYLRRNDKTKALTYFEKSLAINPHQPPLRKLISELKK